MQAMRKKRLHYIICVGLLTLCLTLLMTGCSQADLQQLTGAGPRQFGVSDLPLGTTIDLSCQAEFNNKAVLTWPHVEDTDIYRVYRNRKYIDTISAGGSGGPLTYTDRGLRTGRTYSYQVRAYQDLDGTYLYSGCSDPVSMKARFRHPRILMIEEEETHEVIPREFRRFGCDITSADKLKKSDPDRYDALVIPGGGDVDPDLWGESAHPAAGPFPPDMDRIQIRAIKRFAKAGKPVFGICRGSQLINVAFGGTMIQNLYPDAAEPTYEDGFHTVKNQEDSWVGRIYGTKASVYFHHHQAVRDPGDGIRITSWSTDHPYRHAEAIEHESLPIYGVQWHPDTYTGRQGNEIFKEFVKVCLENMAR